MALSVHIKKKFKGFSLSVDLETDSLITGLLGASGCGKSMTLRCIAGIERPDEGQIILNGIPLFDSKKRIHLPPQERNVGYLFQNYALFPNMTVEQNILTGLSKEKNKQKKQDTLDKMLDFFSLTEIRCQKPHELSGGQAQRTALARILASNPQLLLLDEPFSALDTYLREQLQVQMLQTLQQFGKDTILVTHSRDEAYHMCNHIALMEQGHIFSYGSVKSVFSHPQTVAGARITGCKNIAAAKKIGEHQIQIPEWNLTCSIPQTIPDSLCAIGIRAHAFHTHDFHTHAFHTHDFHSHAQESSGYLPFSVQFINEIEEPFEWILQFRIQGQNPDSLPLWWRIPKEQYPRVLPDTLYLNSDDILLLHPDFYLNSDSSDSSDSDSNHSF